MSRKALCALLLIALALSAAPLASVEWPTNNLPKVLDAPSAKGSNMPHPIPNITLSLLELRMAEAKLTDQYRLRVQPLNCGLTSIRCVPSEYATISLCADAAVAGDTCLVSAGLYDEVVSTVNAGTAGNPITYRAVTDCVSNNGATIYGGGCAKVRRWGIGDNYVTVQGFEVTANGMTEDVNWPVLIGDSDHVVLLNNYIHNTNAIRPCIVAYNSTFTTLRGNNISYCTTTMEIDATLFGPFNIQAGVNDTIKLSVQGGAPQTFTLTPGAARTSVQIAQDIEATITGANTCGGSSYCDKNVTILSNTTGPTASIELLAVAHDAYTTLGMTVGLGTLDGGAIAISSDATMSDWLIEYNVISYVSDAFNLGGDRLVVRDNTFGPSTPYTATHVDMFQPGVSTKVLAEGNLLTDDNSVQNHLMLNEVAATHHVFRYNRTCRTRGSGIWSGGANYLYFYNNTFYDNETYFKGMPSGQLLLRNGSTDNFGGNNIWFNSSDNGSVYQADGNGAITHDYDLWYDTTDPGGAHNVHADPLVTNGATCDFTLQAGSPAIDAGGPLTTVAAADTGSGTTLMLTDARAFQDGWAGVTPDVIAVGTVGNTAAITAINYATGAVTIASGISRSDGDSVWLYSNSRGTRVLYGTAPDMGAFERQP